MDAVEFEVVWNGVNDGCDGDLLLTTSRGPKRQLPVTPSAHTVGPVAKTSRTQQTLQAIVHALDAATAPMSALELAFAARISEYTARRFLSELERRGQVHWSRRQGEYRWIGVYTLVRQPLGALLADLQIPKRRELSAPIVHSFQGALA